MATKRCLTVLTLLWLLALAAYPKSSRVKYLAPDSIYFYSMGSLVHINPLGPDYLYDRENQWGFTLGAGYTLINFNRKLLLNFEFDYSRATFEIFSAQRDVNFYNFRFTGEYRFYPKLPLAVYLGFGVSSIGYSRFEDLGESDDTTAIVDTGLKIRLMKNILVRVEMRFYSYPGDSDYYYYDEYYFYDEYGEGELVGSAFSLGLEFHIK